MNYHATYLGRKSRCSTGIVRTNTHGRPTAVSGPQMVDNWYMSGSRRADRPRTRQARLQATLQTPTDDDKTTDDADRRQRVKQYWPIRRASNNTYTNNIRTTRSLLPCAQPTA